MEEADSAVSGTQQILHEAHQLLIRRRDRIKPFVAELNEVNHAIKVIERATGTRAPAPAGERRTMRGTPGGPRAAFTDKVVVLLKDREATVDQVAHHFGSSVPFVQSILKHAYAAGRVKQTPEGAYTTVLA